MSTSLVIREVRGPVTVLTMNRPDQRNALSRALVAELHDLVDEVSVDESIRVMVLTGAGKAFCSGMDLKEAAKFDASSDAEQLTVATLEEFADLLQKLHTLPKPTIAAVNGDAFAGGAGLMAACDLAIAAEIARIGYPEVERGLVAAIVMHDLTRQVGDRRARQLLFGGMVSGTIAYHWGLVNTVTKNDRCLEEAIRVAEGLAECAPLALATTKRLLDEAANRPRDLRGAAAVSAAIRCSEEAREGIRAFVEKRRPTWAWFKPAEEAS